MINTTYTCDHCTETYPSIAGMAFISININRGTYGVGDNYHKKLWCKTCINESKIDIQPVVIVTAAPTPSLEDFIREIIREELLSNASR